MIGTLIPFGYAGKGSDERLIELMADENTMLLDIRLKPFSRWRPTWSRNNLSDVWKHRYYWVGFKLGNKNYNNDLAIELVDPKGVSYITELLRQEQNVVLLCACKDYETCHRKMVVELVKQVLPGVAVSLRQTDGLKNYWNLPSTGQNRIASEAYPLVENPCIRFHTDDDKPKSMPVNPCLALYGKGEDGQSCKDCIHLRYAIMRNPKAKHWKCDLRKLTHGAATDHKVNWQSCGKYEKRMEPYAGG